MKGKTTLSRGSIGTDFGHKKGYQALDLKGFFSLLLKCSLKTLRSQYVPQIKKKQPGNKWPLKAPCVGCLIVPGARGAAAVFAMSMATLGREAAYNPERTAAWCQGGEGVRTKGPPPVCGTISTAMSQAT